MKRTLRILPLMLGIMLFFTQCEKEADLDRPVDAEAIMNLKSDHACSVTQTLWAGAGQNDILKGTNVGSVTASIDGTTLKVVYDVTNGWSGVEYHLWVGKDIKDIPKNAAPGRFPFSGKASYEIDLDDLGFEPGDKIYVAAHAVVAEDFAGLEEFEEALPETATFSIVLNSPASYLLATVSNTDILNGDYLSYCINPQILISQNVPYSGNVYSSYMVPDGIVTFKENFPQVNWIINNVFVDENTTMADIQEAIWVLLFGERDGDPGFVTSGPNSLGAVDARVTEILTAADLYPEYLPGCGDNLVIVLYNSGVQPIIIWKPVPCGGEETAWAFGDYAFNDPEVKVAKKWGWIFDLNCY